MSGRVTWQPVVALGILVFCALAYAYGRALILTALVLFGYFWLLGR